MKKCFLVKLSDKTKIKIDEDELSVILEGIRNNQAIRLKQAIIGNPNHIICIVPDDERFEVHYLKGGEGKELEPLMDIFRGMDLLLQGDKLKQIT